MRQFENHEKSDKTMAMVVTIIVHVAIVAALVFVGSPGKSGNTPGKSDAQKTPIVYSKPKA